MTYQQPATTDTASDFLIRRAQIVEIMGRAEPMLRSGTPSVHVRGDLVAAGDPPDLVDKAIEALLDPSYGFVPAGLPETAVNGAIWIGAEPPTPDAILPDLLDRGDKGAVIAASKGRKTFFQMQLALCMTAGQDFLFWKNRRTFRVLFLNLEIKAGHFHRRLYRMARGLDILPAAVGDRLSVRNLRGQQFDAAKVELWATEHRADLIIVDPLYRCHDGDENSAQDVKPVLRSFDVLAEHCNATVIYSHHDAKGAPGDRDTRDRGAGSNVLSRDYDAALTLTEHATDADTLVVKSLLRNYPPIESFSILFTGGRFILSDVAPIAKTGTTRKSEWQDAVQALCRQEPHLSRRKAAERLGCSVGIIQRYWYSDET